MELRDAGRDKKDIEAAGLRWEAIWNFDPAHWHDVLLDGPEKDRQTEGLKRTIQNIGRAGIPIMGYNFSIAGVAGRLSRETFIDEGDLDVERVFEILHKKRIRGTGDPRSRSADGPTTINTGPQLGSMMCQYDGGCAGHGPGGRAVPHLPALHHVGHRHDGAQGLKPLPRHCSCRS